MSQATDTTGAHATESAIAFAEALVVLARTERLLVALDFDGVLAPLADDANATRVVPESRAAMRRLEELPDTWVGLVSGRPLDSLIRVSEADERALLIGSHGVEVRLGGDAETIGLTADESSRLHQLEAELHRIVERTPHAMLESKPAGLGLHTRLASDADAERAWTDARGAAEHVGGFLTRGGKDILEFAVRDETKGDGVDRLRAHTGATAVLYAGDDTTDEDAFAVMTGIDVGVKVGDGRTLAQYRVADTTAVATMLTLLASARAER